MQLSPIYIALYALIPMAIALIGGWLAIFYVPNEKVRGVLQHFVAGIVVGAVAVELLPKILGHGSMWTIGSGFVLGAAVMLGLHELSHHLSDTPLGLIGASIVDLFIDGMLIGISFLAGRESGLFIAISLSACAFFLNLSISATLRKRGVSRIVETLSTFLIALMLPIGALVGAFVIYFPPFLLTGTLAFGVAALLYLGIEELLGEAHKSKDTSWITSAFFLGFLAILLFRI